jgi:hypothetical protein
LGIWVFILQIISLALVGGICFGDPSMSGGGFALMRDGNGLFVGGLRELKIYMGDEERD